MQDNVTQRKLVYTYRTTQAASVVHHTAFDDRSRFQCYQGCVGDRERDKIEEDDFDFSSLMTYLFPCCYRAIVAELPSSRHWRPPICTAYILCALPIADFNVHDGGSILQVDYSDKTSRMKRFER
jgi:hypothetical protein